MPSWERERRLDYIDFRMMTAGTIRRADLIRTFGVSMPQASKDINEFLHLYPGAMVYSKTEKEYVREYAYTTRRGTTFAVVRLIELLRHEYHPMGWE